MLVIPLCSMDRAEQRAFVWGAIDNACTGKDPDASMLARMIHCCADVNCLDLEGKGGGVWFQRAGNVGSEC